MDIEREVAELVKRVAALEAAVMTSAAPADVPAATPGPVFLPAVPPATATTAATLPAAQTMPPPPTATSSQVAPPPAPTAPLSGAAAQAASYPPPPGPGDVAPPRPPAAFEWGIESVLRWAGVVLVTLAAIFLVSTAISRGWIGPELQLLGAALGGGAMLGGATALAESRPPWALALGCGGAVVLASSALATHEWLDLVPPGGALVLIGVATAASITVALKLKLEGITLTAGLMAMLASIDTLDNFGDAAILLWVAACIVGSSALGLAKTWPGVRLITGWMGALVLMAYAVSEDVEGALQAFGFVGAAIIAVTLWAGPTVARRLAPTSGPGSWGTFDWQALDYRLVAFVPVWSWAVIAGLLSPIEDQTAGLIAIGTALGFGALAAVTWQQGNPADSQPVSRNLRVQRLVSVTTIFGSFALLALGFAIWLDGPALMVALAGQAVTSYYLSRRLDDRMLRYGSYVVGTMSSGLAVYEMLDAFDRDGFRTVGAGLATLLVLACWVGAAALLYRDDLHVGTFEPPFVGAWAGTMLWSAAALTGAPQGLVLISVAWAIMACAGLVLGLMGRNSAVRNVAMGTLGITLFKLVSVDMAEVDVFWRVGLFFVVGMGLIVLGLKVPALIGPPAEQPEQPEPPMSSVTPDHPTTA